MLRLTLYHLKLAETLQLINENYLFVQHLVIYRSHFSQL